MASEPVVHTIGVEHGVLIGRYPSSYGCWFGPPDGKSVKVKERVGTSVDVALSGSGEPEVSRSASATTGRSGELKGLRPVNPGHDTQSTLSYKRAGGKPIDKDRTMAGD